MTKQEALTVVDQACAGVSAPRQTHVVIAQALEVLKKELELNESSSPKKD